LEGLVSCKVFGSWCRERQLPSKIVTLSRRAEMRRRQSRFRAVPGYDQKDKINNPDIENPITPPPQQAITPVITDYDYGIDQLEIVSRVKYFDLRARYNNLRPIRKDLVLWSDVLNLETLKENDHNGRKSYKEALEQGFKSLLRMTCPTAKFFDLLHHNEKIFGVYKPWIIEPFRDAFTTTDQDAIDLTKRDIKTAYKKFTTKTFLFDKNIPERRTQAELPPSKFGYFEAKYNDWCFQQEKRFRIDESVISDQTLYLGEDDFCFVIYARRSKRTNQPCIHMEWRILWSDTYKRYPKLKIFKKKGSYFESLKNLTELNIADCWEDLTQRFIKRAEINEIKVSKHLLDCMDGLKGFTKDQNYWRTKKRLSAEDEKQLRSEYMHFAKTWEIECTSEFVSYWDTYRVMDSDAKNKDTGLHYSKFLIDIDFMSARQTQLAAGARRGPDPEGEGQTHTGATGTGPQSKKKRIS